MSQTVFCGRMPESSTYSKLVLISVLIISGSILFSCSQKKVEISKEQIIQAQYQESLKQRWIKLTPHDEEILEKCIELDVQGGATIPELRFQEPEAEVLKTKNLLVWHSETQKYKATTLGKDTYEYGQKLKQKELQKDKRYQSKRVLK